MTPEQRPELSSSSHCDSRAKDNPTSGEQAEFDPYQDALKIYDMVVEFLKKMGHLRRPSQIRDEDEQDDHFDDLASVYKRTILFLGLDWLPPVLDPPASDD